MNAWLNECELTGMNTESKIRKYEAMWWIVIGTFSGNQKWGEIQNIKILFIYKIIDMEQHKYIDEYMTYT